MSFLLELVEGGAVRGRYSIIGLDPDVIFRVNGRHAEINRTVQTDPAAFVPIEDAPLAALRDLIAQAALRCPLPCRRLRRAYSAISATTWCG